MLVIDIALHYTQIHAQTDDDCVEYIGAYGKNRSNNHTIRESQMCGKGIEGLRVRIKKRYSIIVCRCNCQHGNNECELNALMNCVIEKVGFAERYLPIIDCIQGKGGLESGLRECTAKFGLDMKE